MAKRAIPEKLRRIAAIRTKKARVAVATASKAVRHTREDLETLDLTQASSEDALLGGAQQVEASSLQLLGLGRDVYRGQRMEAVDELDRRESDLHTERDHQRERMNELRGKERLYEHFLALDRLDLEQREQEETDEVNGTRRGNPAPQGEET